MVDKHSQIETCGPYDVCKINFSEFDMLNWKMLIVFMHLTSQAE